MPFGTAELRHSYQDQDVIGLFFFFLFATSSGNFNCQIAAVSSRRNGRQQTQQAAKCKHVGVLVLVTALRKRSTSTSGVRDTHQLWEEEADISSGVKVGDGESGKMQTDGTEGGARGP